MIRLIDVKKVYDNGTEALKGISFSIEDGDADCHSSESVTGSQ